MLLELQHSDDNNEDNEDNDDYEDNDGDQIFNNTGNKNKLTRSERLKKRKLSKTLMHEAIEREHKKKMKRDLSNLKVLNREIQEENNDREARLLRRKFIQQQNKATFPARLSKIKYTEEAPKVLLSDDIRKVNGNLIKLCGNESEANVLLRDRYKALQRRGIIEPRSKVQKKRKMSKKKKLIVPGSKGQLEEQMMIASKNRNNANAKKTKALEIVQ